MSKETSTLVVPPPGSISRPLGNLEVFFKTLADLGTPLGHEHWTVHLALRVRFVGSSQSSGVDVDPELCLRRAWQVVRRQIPAIGSTISSSALATSCLAVPGEDDAYEGRERLTLAPFDANVWVNDTFVVHRGQHGDDASTLFSTLGPAPTAMCYWLPNSSEILIRSSHWRMDGIGLSMLAHSFLTALAEVLRVGPDAASLEVYTGKIPAASQPLPLCLEDLARQVRSGNKKTSNGHEDKNDNAKGSTDPTLEAGADALVAEFLRGVPSIGLPTRADSENALPGPSARASTRLDAATTARVTAARKAKGFSFTGSVHAAIVRVTAGFPQHPLAKSYAGFFPVNLRQAIAPTGAATDEELVFGLYFSGLPICVDGMITNPGGHVGDTIKSFDDVAREMTAVYGRDLTEFWKVPDGQVVGLLDLAEPYLKRTTALFSAPVPEGLPPVQTPDLSGLGKVEAYLQHEYKASSGGSTVQLEDMWIGTEMLNRSVQFHVWSWRDELNIAACFNQSFYDQSFVAEVLDRIVKELQTGLGL
ncbi:hypothetical protein VMCG_05515 [Cytospora schulzeri]|uniref:Phthiocerol/phthiodiolone dimycocerosyl transferase C-terminal domain-containing protein n=1 Tax=Cytospora schulzeri TaxID=448051 RepID=A0A423WEV1_9PEZI|nr:hypothetical protein VMCG_05515 [Valsa malicola]